MAITAEIITIGDEILYGQTLDTNSHWISSALDAINIKVFQKTTIGDTRDHILTAFREAENRANIILITGGLGPTKDDLTKPLLAEYFGVPLRLNEEALEEITSLFARAGRTMTDPNRKQAELPEGCLKITNRMGTAPGMWMERDNRVFISMPGVPYEMKNMMQEVLLPKLAARFGQGAIFHKIVRTVGVPESHLASLISDWEDQLPAHLKLAYLPSMGQVKLRLTGYGDNEQVLKQEVHEAIKQVLPVIKKHIYGYDEDELESVIGQWLKQQNKTLGTAESCTGGHLAGMITSVPGSSAYYKGTIVSYDNEVKESLLDVPAEMIEKHGAVSEEVVKTMAENVRKKLKVDVGLATSGIAGPDGGTVEKPVGTIWIAYADDKKTIAKKLNFTKDRKLNIQFSALAALNLFRLNFLSN
ncbi:MAG: competence/damage-inducible protein A [Cyclobacteriaceae bacterium]|nr:competence/damage-inducible protein A [Cyclobacteriaceae bacterium HetDA_MAG_MS6]